MITGINKPQTIYHVNVNVYLMKKNVIQINVKISNKCL